MIDLIAMFLFGAWTLGCVHLGMRWEMRKRGSVSLVSPAAKPTKKGAAVTPEAADAPKDEPEGVNFTL